MMEGEIELSLELSIGGCYAKSDSKKEKEGKTRDLCEKIVNGDDKIDDHGFVSSSDFSNVGAENRCEFVDLQRRKEIQALRRREARMKREVKKSRGINNGGGFVEEKLVLDAQQFQSRVQDRESREKDVISEEFALKREENGRKRVVEDLNVSLLSENKNLGTDFAMQTQFVYPQMQYLPIANGFAYPWVVPLWGPNVVEGERNKKNAFQFRLMANGNGNESRNSSIDCDSGNDREVILRRSVEQSSSAVSDCGSASRKGVSSSDTRSHSSSLGTNWNQCVSESEKIEHVEGKDSSSQLEPGQCIGVLNPEHSMKVVSPSPQQLTSSTSKITERSKSRTQSNQTCSTTEKPSSPLSKETSGVINKPPKPPNHNQSVASLQHMPCVSTTGNGPNGKTITGFLYKYTKYEVSIMCVCHGRSFSPAEFVQHAGGVDVPHPLKHITIVPSAMG